MVGQNSLASNSKRFSQKTLCIYLVTFFYFILFTSCSHGSSQQVFGAEEFVMDSYQIAEGKFAILEMQGKSFAALDETCFEECADAVEDGDLLDITLLSKENPSLEKKGHLVQNSSVFFPEIGRVFVGNLSLNQIAQKLSEKLGSEVLVSYKKRSSNKVELMGEVDISSIELDGKLRLFDALSKAKISAQADLFSSYLIREDKQLEVDFYKLLVEGDMGQNIVLKGGDKIYIGTLGASNVLILGEVVSEKILPIPNGFISLREAIASAKGIPFTGDKSYIQVIRAGIACPKIYLLNWDHILHLPNQSLLLMPGDIVYVASNPITEWGRFISQVVPSFSSSEILLKGDK